MLDMSVVVSSWFAKRLQEVIEEAGKEKNQKVTSFAKEKIYPLYLMAVKTSGEVENKFEKVGWI